MAKIIPIDGGNIRLPGDRDRITIIGPTGSGKTVAGLWHLSNANFTSKPWLIVDFKNDDHIVAIEGIEDVDLGQRLKRPGLYRVNPLPHQAPEVDDYLMQIWGHENTGIFIDEAYMLGEGKGFIACLTQGRSKHVPAIILAQRPVGISRFCFSEAQFIQLFTLMDARDEKTAREYAKVPLLYQGGSLPEFWSWYYDVKQKHYFAMQSTPDEGEIIARIEERLDSRQIRRRL